MSSGRRRRELGSVMVMVAIFLPLLALFASFAIDAAHWWDYSRNLQNRADAAALAGGDQLALCLGSPTTQAVQGIGEIAQQYSGPPNGTPDNSANLPYSSTDMTTNGFTPYFNVPNLTAGTGPNFHLLLNSSQYWPTVAQNGANGYGDMGSYCDAVDPNASSSDPNACTSTSPCAMVDAKVTQANVPMFINLLGLHPNISAHARTQLQTVGTLNNAVPIGVGDAGSTGCMAAQLVDETNPHAGTSNDGVLAQWSLSQPNATTDPRTWSGAMPNSLSVPTTKGQPDQLSVQAMIPANCSDPFGGDGGAIYDVTAQNVNRGIVFINTYTPPPQTVSAPTLGSVWLGPAPATAQPASCSDPYFNSLKSGSCTVRLYAQVDFPTGSSAVPTVSEDGGAYTAMTQDTSDPYWHADFAISAQTGRHTFALGWSGAGKGTFDGGSPVQATFAGFDDGTAQDDSGPVITAQVGCSANCPSIGGGSTAPSSGGVDSIPGSGTGSSPTLTVTFTLQGLAQSGPKDKATVLRSSVSDGTSNRTGIIDCGQGPTASAFFNVATGGGCGTYPGTSGLTVYQGALNPPNISSGTQWPGCIVLNANPISCAQPVGGNKRQYVDNAIATIVCGTNSGNKPCTSTPPGQACDYWQPYKAGTGPLPNAVNYPNDPRAIEMMITAPQDLGFSSTQPPWLRVLGFATFYVTGWDGDPYIENSGTTIPGCNPVGNTATNYDEPYPFTGQTPKNAVWGHFIGYVIPGAGGSGQKCVIGSAIACTPALTR